MAKKVYTKDVILRTAYECSIKKGINNISIREIASKLGCSVMPIYESFESKEDLINALSTFNELLYKSETMTLYDRYYRLLQEGLKYPTFFMSVADHDVHIRHDPAIITNLCNVIRRDERLKHLTEREAYLFNTRVEIFIIGIVNTYRTFDERARNFELRKPLLDYMIEALIEYATK